MIRRCFLVAIIATIPISASLPLPASLAQKLVDPDKVAPEYREAAAKRRAEQLKLVDCSHRADAAKVLPRDRAVYVQQCLDAP